ncbi:MAG: hypothetical protein KDK60_02985, partial [Chlamydiia bacterium]|nr:hypothetical protein [Chlamydiia bacterium]
LQARVVKFSHIGLSEVNLTVTSDIYSSPEKRELFASYSAAAWRDAPWSHYIREQSWASEEEISLFQQALHQWAKKEGAFVSATWCEALGIKT